MASKENEGQSQVSRRDLLHRTATGAALAGLAAVASGEPPAAARKSMIGVAFEPRDTVRMGLIGCGGRGNGVLNDWLGVENLQVMAVADPVKDHALKAQAAVERAGQHPPAVYANGEHDFENLLKRDDIDFVYIPTPWEWHVPISVAAMKAGKHALVEVPAAMTLEDCWKLVTTSEQTRRHCIMMENCCYGETELMVLNMVKDGLFGDLLYGAGAYLHDLRRILFEEHTYEEASEDLWRRFPH